MNTVKLMLGTPGQALINMPRHEYLPLGRNGPAPGVC